MSELLIVMGSTPELSFLELTSLFANVRRVSLHSAVVSNSSIMPEALNVLLGGAVRIGEVLGTVEAVEAQTLLPFLPNDQSLTFAVSVIDGDKIYQSLASEIKTLLQGSSQHVRFVSSKHDALISSVVIRRQNVFELLVTRDGNQWLVGKTIASQDVDAWSKRDFGRPFADPHAGMLPPKVARMMINIGMPRVLPRAFPQEHPQGDPFLGARPILLDPFCGMGTVLGEALISGWRVVGSDQSVDVVEKAKKNIEWLIEPDSRNRGSLIPGIVGNWKVFASDATHVSEQLAPDSVDAIVTEPFMGAAFQGGMIKSDQLKIKNIIKGLEKLYIGCLKDWLTVLKIGGRVVIALPKYVIGDKTFFVKKVIDNCETLGYTVLGGPIEYSRPQAVVRREIFVLQKQYTRDTNIQIHTNDTNKII